MLTEATRDQAAEVGERIRRNIEESLVEHDGANVDVTVSIGVTIESTAGDPQVEELIEAADQALYDAKNTGKNRGCSLLRTR